MISFSLHASKCIFKSSSEVLQSLTLQFSTKGDNITSKSKTKKRLTIFDYVTIVPRRLETLRKTYISRGYHCEMWYLGAFLLAVDIEDGKMRLNNVPGGKLSLSHWDHINFLIS